MNVYDFDGTIYNGDSTIDLWKFILKRHPSAVFSLFPAAVGLALYLFGIISKTGFKQQFYTFLKYSPDIDNDLCCFWNKHEHKIKCWYLARKKPDDIIVSASPDFLLKHFCSKLGIRLIASQVDKYRGTYTGDNCYGKEKIRRLEIEHPNIEIDDFYSGSEADIPLAKLASKAYWVSGDSIVPWEKRKVSPAKRLKDTFFTPEFFLFVFCGGCGTLVNFCFSLMLSWRINSTLAYVGGYAGSLFATYALNTYLIFKLPFSFVRFVKFIISYIPNFFILLTVVAVLLNIFGFPELFVYLAAAVFGLPLTFVIVKIFAFGSRIKGDN